MPKGFQKVFFVLLLVLLLFSLSAAQTIERPIRVAVLDFGDTQTGQKVTETLAQAIGVNDREIAVVDRDQTRAAVRGTDYRGSLNMNVEDARDLGAAIGCDFFFTGEAQTLRRTSSERPVYFESYAVIYLVSARTGRLASWRRLSAKDAQPAEAEKELLADLSGPQLIDRQKESMRSAIEKESAERALAIESGAPVIEIMAEENTDKPGGTHPPRPYRRLKPGYPQVAALLEIEATVDVLVDVDKKGEVGRVEIARWAGYGLDESVLDTVKQLHFFPAMREGVAVPMRVMLRYNFRKPPK
jgi:TonB family protein